MERFLVAAAIVMTIVGLSRLEHCLDVELLRRLNPKDQGA